MSARTRSASAGKGDDRRDNFETFRGGGYWGTPLWRAYLDEGGGVVVRPMIEVGVGDGPLLEEGFYFRAADFNKAAAYATEKLTK